MTDNEITFSLPNLQLLKQAKEKTLKQYQDQKNNAISDATRIVNLPDSNMLWAWMSPLLANLKSEDDAKTFARLLVAIFRLTGQIETLTKEIAAVDMMTDTEGPLTLASVSFDQMEVIDDKQPTDS
jgi:hypothetical protein